MHKKEKKKSVFPSRLAKLYIFLCLDADDLLL